MQTDTPHQDTNADGPQSVFSAMMKEFNNFREKEKAKLEDEEGLFLPFAGMEKSAVLQEAKAAFNSPQDVKHEPQKCALLITKLVYLLVIGETFNEKDTTDVFFSVTKLFQSDNINLRRMTYLFLKEFAETTDSDNIIIVVSSLTKDINNSNVKLYRANAIRVLCKIIDSQLLNQIERYIKQSIVDQSSLIASSALISANHMVTDVNKREVIKRWTNEVTEAVNSPSEMVQFHALSLLYSIKQHDKLAVSRMINNYTKNSGTIKSPLGVCLLIRYTVQLLNEDLNAMNVEAAYEFLSSCLRNKNEVVIYEAAKAICNLPNLTNSDLLPAITVLNLFLSSTKSVLKFAAVKTLNEVATKYSGNGSVNSAQVVLNKSEQDLESLINDSNRSVSTLAITTLLKIGNENSIEKLIKQITSLISEIADEFKIVVVSAVHALCIKYKNKMSVLLGFLSTLLREEGGFEFKKVVVDSIVNLVETMPEYKEVGLFHLCEFIEDCEFTQLCTKVLFYLGEYGPSCKNSNKFIRYIYNRIILENAQVRAASVTALGKFGAKCEGLRDNVKALLNNCLLDDDDEVRDRATFCLRLLGKNTSNSFDVLINKSEVFVDPIVLQKQLEVFESNVSNVTTVLLSFSVLPHIDRNSIKVESKEPEKSKIEHDEATQTKEIGGKSSISQLDALFAVKQFSKYGRLLKSGKLLQLTESEAEYFVTVQKHLFSSNIVFQFNITNTLSDQVLGEATVIMEETENVNAWKLDCVVPSKIVRYGETKSCFVSYSLPVEKGLAATFLNELKFKVYNKADVSTSKDGELIAGEAEDEEEYPIEDIEVTAADLMCPMASPVANFRNIWNSTGSDDSEVREKLQLPEYKSLKACVEAVISVLGLQACEGTGEVSHETTHTLLLAGSYRGESSLLVKMQFNYDLASKKTLVKVAIRAEDPQIAELIVGCL